MIPKNKIDVTIRIKLSTIDSITLLNYIFDANQVDSQFDSFRERVYLTNKSFYSLNLEGLLLYDNKLMVSVKVFDKEPLIIILIREVYA
jgi:hypothetical protein